MKQAGDLYQGAVQAQTSSVESLEESSANHVVVVVKEPTILIPEIAIHVSPVPATTCAGVLEGAWTGINPVVTEVALCKP